MNDNIPPDWNDLAKFYGFILLGTIAWGLIWFALRYFGLVGV